MVPWVDGFTVASASKPSLVPNKEFRLDGRGIGPVVSPSTSVSIAADCRLTALTAFRSRSLWMMEDEDEAMVKYI